MASAPGIISFRAFAWPPNTRYGWNSICKGRERLGEIADLVAGCCCDRRSRHARPFPQLRLPVHAVAHMQHKLRRRSSYPFAMRHAIKRPLEFRVLRDVILNLRQALARRAQALLELRLGLHL